MDDWPTNPHTKRENGVAPSNGRGHTSRDARRDALLTVLNAVERYSTDGTPPNSLVTSADALGRVARSEGIPPERLIVELKQTLNQMPALAALEPLARSDIAARVILLAIDAYYGDGKHDGTNDGTNGA